MFVLKSCVPAAASLYLAVLHSAEVACLAGWFLHNSVKMLLGQQCEEPFFHCIFCALPSSCFTSKMINVSSPAENENCCSAVSSTRAIPTKRQQAMPYSFEWQTTHVFHWWWLFRCREERRNNVSGRVLLWWRWWSYKSALLGAIPEDKPQARLGAVP